MSEQEPILPGLDENPPPPSYAADQYDEEDEGYDDDPGEQPANDGAPRRRGRSRGKNRVRPADQVPVPPGRLKSNEEIQAADDLDIWGTKFDWSIPGMKMQLHRRSPTYEGSVKVAGYLESKDTAYTIEEISHRFGGGDFEATVIGPSGPNNPRPRLLNRKRFSISGRPIINQDNIPEELRQGPPGRTGTILGPRGMGGGDPTAKALTEIVGSQLDALNRKVFQSEGAERSETKLLKDAYAQATNIAIAATQDKANAAATASEQVAQMYRDSALRAEQETQRLKEEHERMREQLRSMEMDMATKVQEASGNSFGLLAQLLPTFSTSTQEQVRLIISQYEAREERQAAQYQSQINNVNAAHEAQLKAVAMANEVQQKVIASTYDNTITLLKGQIQNLEAEKAHLGRQLDDARRMFEDARKELMTNIQTSKQQPDSLEQMMKFAQMKDAMEGLFGNSNASGDSDSLADGVDNPMLKSLLKVGDKVVPHLPAILDAFKGRQQQMPQMYSQQQQAQLYPQPMQYPQQVQQPQQMMVPYPPSPQQMPPQMPPQMPGQMPMNIYQQQPQQQQQQPAAQPKPKKKQQALLKKEDVRPALEFINGILSQPEPPAASEIVQMALMQADHQVLKALASREPMQVIANMEAAGLMMNLNNLHDDRGKQYLAGLLVELRKVL